MNNNFDEMIHHHKSTANFQFQNAIFENNNSAKNARNIKASQNGISSRRRIVEIYRTSTFLSSYFLPSSNHRLQPFQFKYLLFLAISFLIASSSLFVCQARASYSSVISDDGILRTLPSLGPKEIGKDENKNTLIELRLLDQSDEEEDDNTLEDESGEDEKNAATIEDINDLRTESISRPINEAIWWYFLANLNGKTKQHERRRNFDNKIGKSLEKKSSNSNGSLLKAPAKKAPIRRCGTLLIKHIQTVCNGCLRSGSDADPIIMSKRGGSENQLKGAKNRWKREVGFSKITDICCTQRACADEELKPFCC